MREDIVVFGLMFAVILAVGATAWGGDKGTPNGQGKGDGGRKFNPLTPAEERVIVYKGTEAPGTGEYLHTTADGTYVCRRCGAPLYRSSDKFDSGCGWPAFDDEIPGAVARATNPGDNRIEILCAACGAHLGHVFAGERLTPKNVRHCVNSVSMKFIPAGSDTAAAGKAAPTATRKTDKAYFAAGCFWGVEHWFKKAPGVVRTRVGYMGGGLDNPTYNQVSTGMTGHAEALEVEYDPSVTDYETLARLFFEIHDFTQADGQGPDIGPQYRSEVFVTSPEQRETTEKLLALLRDKGYRPATRVSPAGIFWPAEDYHQDYYAKTGKSPYCHVRRPVF